MNKLAEKVKSLFTEDLVKLVIGFERDTSKKLRRVARI